MHQTTRRVGTAALALSSALTALAPAPARAGQAVPASVWAAPTTAPAWVDPSATVQFYVATPTLAREQVGHDLTLRATATGMDCSDLSVGQQGSRGWRVPARYAVTGCTDGELVATVHVDETMVGDTVELHGWVDGHQARTVTIDGHVVGGGLDATDTTTVAARTGLPAPVEVPTAAPTPLPTATAEPTATATPTTAPTATRQPTATPTVEPTATPTKAPTAAPTQAPTVEPTATATAQPTQEPTARPTTTAAPTQQPTVAPTQAPAPTAKPVVTPPAAPATRPTLDEGFESWPAGSQFNADRTMQVNGDWMGTDNNMLYRSNVAIAGGIATMTSRGNQQSGAELQSTKDKPLGVGYYEARMQMSDVPGILSGIFFISEDYQAPEVDIEVRSRDNGPGGRHSAFFTVRQAGQAPLYQEVRLGFDPAAGFHTYGFAMGTDRVTFFIDGVQQHEWTGLQPNLGGAKPPSGYLMTNSWAKNEEWVGPVPTRDTTTRIDHLRHWAGATAPQA